MDDIVPFHGVEQNVKAPDHADADGFLSAAVEGRADRLIGDVEFPGVVDGFPGGHSGDRDAAGALRGLAGFRREDDGHGGVVLVEVQDHICKMIHAALEAEARVLNSKR